MRQIDEEEESDADFEGESTAPPQDENEGVGNTALATAPALAPATPATDISSQLEADFKQHMRKYMDANLAILSQDQLDTANNSIRGIFDLLRLKDLAANFPRMDWMILKQVAQSSKGNVEVALT